MGPLVAGELKAARAREVRRGYQAEGRRLARERSGSYLAGCMLYWAEGDKQRGRVGISNADAPLLRFFAEFLREHFVFEEDRFRIHCNLFADHLERQTEVEQLWLDQLNLPLACLSQVGRERLLEVQPEEA